MLLGIVTSKSLHDDARFGAVVGARDIAVARVAFEDGGGLKALAPANLRREHFTLAHEGVLADIALLRRRISPRRAFQIESDAHADSLFAYLLSHVDSAETMDGALERAVVDIASSGLRGNFSFVLGTAESMYVHCAGSDIGVVKRADAVIASSESFTSEARCHLSSGALLRVDRGAAVGWRLLCGCVDMPSSRPELPFTD